MNLVLLGPSGVGKGTHAGGLAARHHLRHLATGDLFREHVRGRTPLGLLARRYMAQGDLVPDEVVEAMIEASADTLAPHQGTLFDGFPRTPDQVRFLDELFARLGGTVHAAIYLRVDDDEVVARLLGRAICRDCQAPYHDRAQPPRHAGRCDRCGGELYRRPDDTEELARARLRTFHRVTEPVLAHYARVGKLIVVSGVGAIDAVDQRLVAAIDAVRRRTAAFTTLEELAGVLPAWLLAPPLLMAPPVPDTLDFVLLGAPGSGKGTQAEQLAAALRVPHIATGDLFRESLRLATPLGVLAKACMDRGELVPDEVTDAMVEQRLARPDARAGFILDGFPRTLPQAHALDEMLARHRRRLAGVICLRVADAALVERLAGRLICRQCQAPHHRRFKPPRRPGRCDHCDGELYQRSDDTAETVRARLATFHRQTEPLVAHYRVLGRLHEVDGEGGLATVGAECFARVRAIAGAAADGAAPPHYAGG